VPSDTQLELAGYQRATRQADRPQAVTGTNHQAQFMLLTAATVTGHLATVAGCSGGAGTWPADAERHGQYSVCASFFLSHECSSPHCRLMGLHRSEMEPERPPVAE